MGRFRLLTHNILADVWCIPAYYPNLPDPGRHLASNRRRTATYHHIRAAEPDLICLQEVQVTELQHLYDAFHDEFHLSDLAANCPTTAPYAHGTLAMIRKRSLFGNRVRIGAHVWSDEGSAGQILELTTTSGRSLTVANLHLSWKRYGSEARLQAIEVERRLDEAGADPSTTIWCGDFNTTPNRLSTVLPTNLCLRDAFADRYAFPTWYSPRRNVRHRLDYVLHGWRLQPMPIRAKSEPNGVDDDFESIVKRFGSDHIPLCCDFTIVT